MCQLWAPRLFCPEERGKNPKSGLFKGCLGQACTLTTCPRSEAGLRRHFLREHVALGKLWGSRITLLKGRILTPANFRMNPGRLELIPKSPICWWGLLSSLELSQKLEQFWYTSDFALRSSVAAECLHYTTDGHRKSSWVRQGASSEEKALLGTIFQETPTM